MKKHRTIVVLVVLVVIAILWMVFAGNGDEEPTYEAVTVERGTVEHIVSVTGHLEPLLRLSLAFPVGGQVSRIIPAEGDTLEKGDPIAYLDAGSQSASVAAAAATLAQQEAVLDEILAPLRTEERDVQEAALASAQTTFAQAEIGADTALLHGFVYADDAIREEADELFDLTQSGSPEFGITFKSGTTKYTLKGDAQTNTDLSNRRREVESILQNMRARSESPGDLGSALEATQDDLAYIALFLSDIALVVNEYMPDDTSEQTVYESFQTTVATARAAVSAAETEVNTALKTYRAAETALALAEGDFSLAVAGASDESIAAQRAAVAAAEASLRSARESSADTVLRAPIGGVLARIVPNEGEVVSAYAEVAELLTEGSYEIETFIPEADIARVQLGNIAHIEFDAFEKTDVFAAEVVRIAASETMREGGPTYKTTLVLTEFPERELMLRPGMTADVEIMTDVADDVLYVPVRSVLRDGARTYVRIYEDGEFIERNVTTGLRGSEGTIEILSGVDEGEEIVLFVDEL
jgi:RND family efflux transporter MFP subunit